MTYPRMMDLPPSLLNFILFITVVVFHTEYSTLRKSSPIFSKSICVYAKFVYNLFVQSHCNAYSLFIFILYFTAKLVIVDKTFMYFLFIITIFIIIRYTKFIIINKMKSTPSYMFKICHFVFSHFTFYS